MYEIQLIGVIVISLLLAVLMKYVTVLNRFMEEEFGDGWGKFVVTLAIIFWPWTLVVFTVILSGVYVVKTITSSKSCI